MGDLEKILGRKGKSYKQNALELFQSRLGKKVTSQELAQVPGKDGKPISHNIRRIFELRDEDGYEIVNWKDNDWTELKLKVNEWVLLRKDPNPKKIRPRGVNKRIMFEVFSRDDYQCRICGRTRDDDDPFRPGHKIKLHVGHIRAHKRKRGEEREAKKLTKDDFITLCNVCNEGAKDKDIKIITLLDRVKKAKKKDKEEILEWLKTNVK